MYFPDLKPWERDGVRPIINALKQICTVHEIESNHPIPDGTGAIWVLAKNWKKAVRKLRNKPGQSVYASVFGLSPDSRNLFTLLWRNLRPAEFSNVKLFAHSPINFRFFSELEGLRKDQIVYLPLCGAPPTAAFTKHVAKGPIVIGAFGAFEQETNFNFILNIAHYVVRQRPTAKFQILGTGALQPHLARIVTDLGLKDNVTLVQTVRSEEISALDILLYAPLRNDHFLPLIFGAAAGVTAVSTELPGIDTIIQDGKTGFVVPVNETKPMGELVVRLLDNPSLRIAMAAEFRHQLFKKLDGNRIAQEYEREIFGHQTASASQAA